MKNTPMIIGTKEIPSHSFHLPTTSIFHLISRVLSPMSFSFSKSLVPTSNPKAPCVAMTAVNSDSSTPRIRVNAKPRGPALESRKMKTAVTRVTMFASMIAVMPRL